MYVMKRLGLLWIGILSGLMILGMTASAFAASAATAVAESSNHPDLIGNPDGANGGTWGWSLAFGGREASLNAVRRSGDASPGGDGWWLHYHSTLSEPIGDWVQYDLDAPAGGTYTCTFEAMGSGTIYANAYDGSADIAAAPHPLSATPQRFSVTLTSIDPSRTQLQLRYRTPPVDVYFRHVSCLPGTSGAVGVPDLKLSRAAATPPAGLTWPTSRTFPRFQPTTQLTLVNAAGLDYGDRVALSSLEGLINRPRPQIYVLDGSDDAFWAQEALPGVTTQLLALPALSWSTSGTDILAALLKAFPGAARGLVIYDPAQLASVDVGTTLAGIKDAMLVSPEAAKVFAAQPYNLPVVADLRSYHWRSAIDAYVWALGHLWTQTQHRLLFSLDPHIAGNLREYAVATRGFAFWLDPTKADERGLLAQLLHASPPNLPVLGWWTDEPAGVALASSAARYTIASDFSDNLSVFGAFALSGPLKQRPPLPLPKLGPRVYVSVEFSDGDNLQFMQHRMRAIWQAPQRETMPVAYTIQPWAGQAIPSILEYYYAHSTAANLFVAGPSGPGYAYPAYWPAEQRHAWLAGGAPLLAQEDIRDEEVWRYGRADGPGLSAYIDALHPRSLLLGNGGDGSITARDGTILVDNVGQAESIDQAVQLLRPFARRAAAGPVFVNLYVDAWTFDPSWVATLASRLGPDYALVRLDQLLALYSEAEPSTPAP